MPNAKQTRFALIAMVTAIMALFVSADQSPALCPCAQGQSCFYNAPLSDDCGLATIPDNCECDENDLCPETFWFEPHEDALGKLDESQQCPPFPPGACPDNCVGTCFVYMRSPCLYHYPCVSLLGVECNHQSYYCFHDDPEVISPPGWWNTGIPCCNPAQ